MILAGFCFGNERELLGEYAVESFRQLGNLLGRN